MKDAGPGRRDCRKDAAVNTEHRPKDPSSVTREKPIESGRLGIELLRVDHKLITQPYEAPILKARSARCGLPQEFRRHPARREIFTRQIDTATVEVFGHIPEDIRQLKRKPTGIRSRQGGRSVEPPDMDRCEAHRGSDPSAVAV